MAQNDVTTKLVVKGDTKNAVRALKGLRGSLRGLARNSGLSKVSGQLRNIFRRLKGVVGQARTLGRLGRGIGLGLSVGIGVAGAALLKMSREYAEVTDEQAKFGRQVGFSIQGLRELSAVSELQGVSQSTLTSSLGALSKRVGELKNGGGALFAFLKKTNPAFLQQLKTVKNTEEAFGLMLGAMHATKDETKRAALASAAFSRAGLPIALLSELSAKDLAAARAEVRNSLGVITEKDAGKTEAFNDSLSKVKLSFTGLRDAIGKDLLPQVTGLAEQLAKWVASNRVLLSQNVNDVVKALAGAIKSVDWKQFIKDVGGVAKKLGGFVDNLGGFKTVMAGIAVITFGGTLAQLALLGIAIGGLTGAGPLFALAAGFGALSVVIASLNNGKLRKIIDNIGRMGPDIKVPIIPGSGASPGFTAPRGLRRGVTVPNIPNLKELRSLPGMLSAPRGPNRGKAIPKLPSLKGKGLGGPASSFKAPRGPGRVRKQSFVEPSKSSELLALLRKANLSNRDASSQNGKAEIIVRLQNFPAGTVTTAKTSGKLFRGIKLDTGVAMAKS